MYSFWEELADVVMQVSMLFLELACILAGLAGIAALYDGLVWVITS